MISKGLQLLTIVGARPQFIKAAAISNAINKLNRDENLINEKILHTGQHYDLDMSDKFFDELEIPKPFLNLGIKTRLLYERYRAKSDI